MKRRRSSIRKDPKFLQKKILGPAKTSFENRLGTDSKIVLGRF